MGERGNKFIGRKQTDMDGRLKSGPISESGIGKELFHETFHPFWKSYFSRLAAAASVLGVRERRGKKSSRAVVGDIANLCNLPATRSLYLNARMAVVGLCTVVRECIASRALPPAGAARARPTQRNSHKK